MNRPLFEFEDQQWFPDFLREYQTDFLGFIAEKTSLYASANLEMESEHASTPKVLCDLASGDGTAAIQASEGLRAKQWKLILTDRYPNQNAVAAVSGRQNLEYLEVGLNVLEDSLPRASVYSMFNAFHHFTLAEQLLIARAIKENGGKLHIFEPLQPTFLVFIKVVCTTSLGLLLIAPFIKPFSFKRILFTYILPIGVIVTFWDGIISVLRALSKREIRIFAELAQSQGLSVSHKAIRTNLAKLTHITVE